MSMSFALGALLVLAGITIRFAAPWWLYCILGRPFILGGVLWGLGLGVYFSSQSIVESLTLAYFTGGFIYLALNYFGMWHHGKPAVSGAAADVTDDAARLQLMTKPYDPENFINLKKGIFLGLNSAKKPKPIYVDRALLDKNHWEILGESGVGKSSLAGVLLSQLAASGETVIVFDPKADRNLPGVLARAGASWGKYPVHVIDLRPQADFPQINPFLGCRRDQVEELLQVALNLGKADDAAVDYHRGRDRDATGFLVDALRDGVTDILELRDLASQDERCTEQDNFWRELRQLARVRAMHTSAGLDLAGVMSRPGVLYIIGSTTRLEVVAAQKLILQRVLQVLEDRRDQSRPVCLFLDELKYLLSPAALRAAGTVRDRNCHLIFAHQSLGDLDDCPGLSPKAVKGAIWGNSGIKVVYKVLDSTTAKELEAIAGTTAVVGTRTSESDAGESIAHGVEKGLYLPAHVITHLPKPTGDQSSVGVVFGDGPAWPLATHWLKSGPMPEPVRAPECVQTSHIPAVEAAAATTAAAVARDDDDLSDLMRS